MVDYGRVLSKEKPQEITITASSVFIASNIAPFEDEVDGYVESGYSYDYIGYSKDEYLMKLAKENNNLQQELIDTQLALVELYEGGSTNG